MIDRISDARQVTVTDRAVPTVRITWKTQMTQPQNETVAAFTHDGFRYEIDHLGINRPETRWGEYAIYREGEQVAGFSVAASWFNAGYRPRLPSRAALIFAAQHCVQSVGE